MTSAGPPAPPGLLDPAGGTGAAGLLLAAGAGRRLGGPKALVRLDGELLVERGVRLLRDGGCDPVLVVLGAAADEVVARADLGGARVVRNPAWETGMGSSLRAGLAALADSPAGAAVLALVDQPLVGAAAVRRLGAAWRAEPSLSAAVATYGGLPRNPVLLARGAWHAAADAAQGDVGARAFLRAARGTYDARVVEVACDGTGSPDDVDTPEQLAALIAET